MSIRSFVIHVQPGGFDALVDALERHTACAVYPARNAAIVILVTAHTSRAEEEAFDRWLLERREVASVALVSGFNDEVVEPAR